MSDCVINAVSAIETLASKAGNNADVILIALILIILSVVLEFVRFCVTLRHKFKILKLLRKSGVEHALVTNDQILY